MVDGWKLAFAAGFAAAAMAGCSREDATGQNVAIDINNADPSDIEAVPADETADGVSEEPADTNTDTNNGVVNAY